jgi:DNA-directed RNA polymerase specialized sigma24 family protein
MSWKELENETTENLIEYIRWYDDAELIATAEDAFRAFCFRFQSDLVKKCRVICHNLGYSKEVADDLSQRTFERFLKYPKFDPAKSRSNDYDTGVRLYLYGIAQRLLFNLYADQDKFSPYSGEEGIVYELLPLDSLPIKAQQRKEITARYELIQKAMDRLGPKHKIIYLTYQRYQEKGFKLPRQLTEKLRTELELTQATIHFYKKEAYDKVQEYLEIYASK